MEAFSDGVIAILITIMVLSLRVPTGSTWHSLRMAIPPLLIYALSFVFLGVYWTNHHHLAQTVQRVTGGILWANLNLLFWLSLIPFATKWIGTEGITSASAAVYSAIGLACGIAYSVLARFIIVSQGPNSALRAAVGRDVKGLISLVAYATGIAVAFFLPWISIAIAVAVAAMWFVPDKRIERRVVSSEAPATEGGT